MDWVLNEDIVAKYTDGTLTVRMHFDMEYSEHAVPHHIDKKNGYAFAVLAETYESRQGYTLVRWVS
jgi:hypothetical protein